MAQNFNRKEPLYQPIRWTNVSLFWLFYIVEIVIASPKTPNVAAVAITFFIARYFARKWYDTKDNSMKTTQVKIAYTVGIYLSVFIIKMLVFSILINVLF